MSQQQVELVQVAKAVCFVHSALKKALPPRCFIKLTSHYDCANKNSHSEYKIRKTLAASASFWFEREDNRQGNGGFGTEPGNRPKTYRPLVTAKAVWFNAQWFLNGAMNLKIQKATCVFCYVKDETEVTLALSTKDDVTAHQNCLVSYYCLCLFIEWSICGGGVRSFPSRN